MITLYFAPRTRSVRIRWLLEELGLPYDLRRVTFNVLRKVFSQDTPLGKLPVIERLQARPAFQAAIDA